MKKITCILLIAFSFTLNGCDQLQKIAEQIPQDLGLSNADIGEGLREALDKGIDQEVSKLMSTDGFYRNSLVKILLPAELQKVDKTLRDIGLSSVADEGLKLLNRAAEDAVKEAKPIFVQAVREITFNDAKNILLGNQDAATQYLEVKTNRALYSKFNPIIKNSLGKVGATKIWSEAITRYNAIPLTDNVNPDLTDYVTKQALEGVYTMIAKEEKDIRTRTSQRTTDLLKRVFALQD